jgi:hypothetical protein
MHRIFDFQFVALRQQAQELWSTVTAVNLEHVFVVCSEWSAILKLSFR